MFRCSDHLALRVLGELRAIHLELITIDSYRSERRDWKPNVQFKRFESSTLEENHRLMVTTKAMRCIRKVGGLDPYLLSSKFVGDSVVGTVLRARVLAKLAENPHLPTPKPLERTCKIPKSWQRVSTE